MTRTRQRETNFPLERRELSSNKFFSQRGPPSTGQRKRQTCFSRLDLITRAREGRMSDVLSALQKPYLNFPRQPSHSAPLSSRAGVRPPRLASGRACRRGGIPAVAARTSLSLERTIDRDAGPGGESTRAEEEESADAAERACFRPLTPSPAIPALLPARGVHPRPPLFAGLRGLTEATRPRRCEGMRDPSGEDAPFPLRLDPGKIRHSDSDRSDETKGEGDTTPEEHIANVKIDRLSPVRVDYRTADEGTVSTAWPTDSSFPCKRERAAGILERRSRERRNDVESPTSLTYRSDIANDHFVVTVHFLFAFIHFATRNERAKGNGALLRGGSPDSAASSASGAEPASAR